MLSLGRKLAFKFIKIEYMKIVKRVVCASVIALFLTLTVVAQEKAYIPFNQVKFSITPAMYDNLKIENQGIGGVFKSKPSIGGEIAVSYYQNIVGGFGVNLGVGWSSVPYNDSYSFIPAINNPTEINNRYADGISNSNYSRRGMMVIPLSLNMYIPGKNKSWLCNLELGAKFNLAFYEQVGHLAYYGEPGLGNNINSEDPVADIKEKSLGWVEYGRNRKELFSYFFKVGFVKVMNNKNTWHLNVVANYSPQKIGKGSYMLHTVNGDSYGTFEQNINFIGLEVAYGLTLCKKKNTPDMR